MNEERYDYLKEELIETIGKMRKELLWTRVINSILIVMLTIIFVVGGIVIYKVQEYGKKAMEYADLIEEYMEKVEPMLTQLEQVDVASINEAIAALDMEGINETITALDVEAINAAFEGIDAEKLGETLERLDEAMNSLEGATKKFQDMMEEIKKFFKW